MRAVLRLARSGGPLLAISLVVWLVVAPLVMARFHLLSPAAIVLGPLVALPVTLAMASGFAVLGLGAIAPVLAFALRLGLRWQSGDCRAADRVGAALAGQPFLGCRAERLVACRLVRRPRAVGRGLRAAAAAVERGAAGRLVRASD